MIPTQRVARVVLGLLVTSLGVVALARLTRAADAPPAQQQQPAKDAVEQAYDIHDMLWAAGNGTADDGRDDTRHALVEQITDLLRETVDPDAWENGSATLREHDGRLLVKASPAIHVSIASLLDQFRDGPAGVQGISLDCQFIIADEAFLKREIPEILKPLPREGDGDTTRPADASLTPGVRAIGPFKARQLAEAARVAVRRTGAVVVVPAVMPLYYMNTSFTHGEELALKLPLFGGDTKQLAAAAAATRPSVEIKRPIGMSLSVRGAYDTRYVTLDLSARHAELDAKTDGTYVELEAAYRETFTVERSGAFIACAPLTRARLSGVRESDGGAAGAVRREVAREPVAPAEQPDPRRFMLLVGTARVMTSAEVTLLAGELVARVLSERETEKADLLPAAPAALPPGPPGIPPAPPPPPQPPDNGESTRVYNAAGLLLGSEPDGERQAARAKRLKRVLDAITKATGQETHVRELAGQIIATARRSEHAKIYSLLNEMIEAQVLRPQ